MVIMQGASAYQWFWISLALTVVLTIAIWLMAVIGRDLPEAEQKRLENSVINFGPVSENEAPIPKFLRWIYIGVAVWSVFYLFWTGIKGLI